MIPSHTTVDTDRYTPVKRSVTDLTISTPGSKARPEVDAAPSRWVTTEFKVYYAVFAIVVPLMVWIPIRLSLGKLLLGDPSQAHLRITHELPSLRI